MMMKVAACVLIVCLGGCAARSSQTPLPGSESIVLTQNPADVAGARLISSASGRQGNKFPASDAMVMCRNYVLQTGGNIGLYSLDHGEWSTLVTISSYER